MTKGVFRGWVIGGLLAVYQRVGDKGCIRGWMTRSASDDGLKGGIRGWIAVFVVGGWSPTCDCV